MRSTSSRTQEDRRNLLRLHLARFFLFGSSAGFSIVAFASYFDVYSHRYIYVNYDPWYNPAHILLYGGFLILLATLIRAHTLHTRSLSLFTAGVVLTMGAAGFNEFWHRILHYGNPLPEPYPIEPPHAMLAVGFIAAGIGALLFALEHRKVVTDLKAKLAVSFLSGSLWLIVAGSAFYTSRTYDNSSTIVFLTFVVASFCASLFLTFSATMTRSFGFATGSYLWYILVNYVFFLMSTRVPPLGVIVVAMIDLLLIRYVRTGHMKTRVLTIGIIALLYGMIYFPLLSIRLTSAANVFLIASFAGAFIELVTEIAVARAGLGRESVWIS